VGDLGSVLLSIGVDDAPLRAGFERARQLAQRAGDAIVKGLSGNGGTLNGLNLKLSLLQTELGKVEIGTKYFRELRQEIEKTQKALDRAQGVGGGGAIFGGLAGGLAGIGVGATAVGFLKGSIDAAVELESITKKLSNTLGEQGAAGALSFTQGLSDRLGLSFKTLANSFGSFTAAASAANVPLDVQRNLFAAVAQAGQQLGLSNDEINGSLLALQQIASKGNVQMEELRGQLGERLPIAFAAAANGLGVTQQQLIKLIETGKLSAQDFFPALTKGLNDLTASSAGAPTAAQNFQKLSNAWDKLQTSFGKNLLPTVTATVTDLTKVLDDFATRGEADKLGLNFVPPDLAKQVIERIQKIRDQYGLTQKQAGALFTDAAKLSGLELGTFGTGLDLGNLEESLKRLPGLAEDFQSKWGKGNKDLLRQRAILGELTAVSLNRYAKQSQEVQQIDSANKLIAKGRVDIEKAYKLYTQLQDPKVGASTAQLNDAAELVKKSYQNFRDVMIQGARDVANILTSAVNKLTDARLTLAGLQGAKDQGLNKYLNPEQQQLRLNTATASLGPDLERAISVATSLLKTQGISLDKTFIADLRSIVAGAGGKTATVGTINGQPLVSAAGPQATTAGLDRVQQFIRDALGENSAMIAVQTATQNLSEINGQLVTVNGDLLKQVQALAQKQWQVNVNVPGGTASGDVLGPVNAGF
jgi:tape measure domain-containing protein